MVSLVKFQREGTARPQLNRTMRINGFEFEFPFARYAVIRSPFIFFTTCLFLFVNNILGPFCWIRFSMSFINVTEWKTFNFIYFINGGLRDPDFVVY